MACSKSCVRSMTMEKREHTSSHVYPRKGLRRFQNAKRLIPPSTGMTVPVM